jgi:hypothetical protein
MAKRRKTDLNDILLYGAIGVASGFAVNFIQNWFIWYFFRKESLKLYNAGVEKYGKAFMLWWDVQKIEIDAQIENYTEEKKIQLLNEAYNQYTGVTDKNFTDAEKWYKENCKWIGKSEYFRQRYAYSNYALIIAGLVPMIANIKSKSLQYILYGGAITGLYNAVRYNYKKFDIYKLQEANKIYIDISKAVDKDFKEAWNTAGGWGGYILYDITEFSDKS